MSTAAIVDEMKVEDAARLVVDLVDTDADELDERTRVELATFRAFASEYIATPFICKCCHG